MRKSAILPILSAFIIFIAMPALGGDIHRAIEANDAALVSQILKANPAAVNERDEGHRFKNLPIHFTAETGNVEIARILLDAGADINAGDSDNSTAIGTAAMKRHADLVTFLIERGASLTHRDRKGDTPLSFAVYGGDMTIIRKLIDAGADIYYMSPSGETLLHIAARRNLPELAALLVDMGADINSRSVGGITPLVSSNWSNSVDCMRVLIEKGADVNYARQNGRSSVIDAAGVGYNDILKLLIENGADVNRKGGDGETALVEASAGGYSGCVATLLAAKADPDLGTDKSGRTALHLSAIGGYPEIARQLIEAGARTDAAAPSGETPIELARYYGHGDVEKVLAAKGAGGTAVGSADKTGPGSTASSAGGKGSKSIDRSLAGIGDVGKKEAAVWFLGHNGWAVKTCNYLLIFDYWPRGEAPSDPGLCNGRIDPAEIAGCKVVVFASHLHQDHYVPAIFEWREQVEDITYFLGLQPRDTVPAYEYMEGRMEKTYGDLKLTTIPATDAGVAMVVEVDGVTILHGGDHSNGKTGLMGGFTDEIDFLAQKGIRPDICFFGIRGCSLGDPAQVKEGIIYTLETLKPRAFIPMHAMADGAAYREFIEDVGKQFKAIRMAAPENRGDSFFYKNGKLEDPRDPMKSRQIAGSKDGSCKDAKKEGCSGS